MRNLVSLVTFASLILLLRSQVSPHHCYDFTSNSVTDQCGGAVDLI